MGSNPISSDLFLRVVRILAAQPRLRLASLMQGALVFAHQCSDTQLSSRLTLVEHRVCINHK